MSQVHYCPQDRDSRWAVCTKCAEQLDYGEDADGGMPARPELDALVAEKVMGWTVDPIYRMYTGGEMRHAAGENMATRFNPSVDIRHAWEVAEKFTTFSVFYDDATCTWFAAVDSTRRTPDGCRYKGAGETAPLAICRAALEAVR